MRIFIADDDQILVKGIRTIIERYESDNQIIGEAFNGADALESIKKLKPDLLITDIKMPIMDGIELVKKIKEQQLNIKVIVISGYGEYKYVRQTLTYGAIDYLLKPIENNDLLELIDKVKNDIKIENERKVQLEKNRLKMIEGLTALKEKFLLDLVKNEKHVRKDIQIKLDKYGINPRRNYYLAVIEISNSNRNKNNLLSYDYSIITMVIQKCFKEYETIFDILTSTIDNNVVLLVGVDRAENYKSILESILNHIRIIIKKEYNFIITIGISDVFYNLDVTHWAYEQSQCALQRKFYEGINKVIEYDFESLRYIEFRPENISIKVIELKRCVEIGNKKTVKEATRDIFNEMCKLNIEPMQFREIWLYIITSMDIALKEFDDVLKEYTYQKNSLLYFIKSVDTLKQLKEAMFYALPEIIDRINIKRIERCKKTIEKSKEYIKNHFKEDISLKDVAEHVYLNPSYLSDLFKRETGQNFTNFLAEVRINEAKKLLIKPEIKVYEVGAMVGYNEPASFSRAFKRIVKISPCKYKKYIK